jgi:quinol monooxygenase YgiN
MGEVRKEEGCLQFELLQSTADETVLTVYETWETNALWQNHLKSKHMLEFNPRTKELFNDISVEEFSFILGE